MPKKVIAISGSPGVGKSTLAKILSKELKLARFDISKHYKKVSISYNKEKQCYDVDIKKFVLLIKEKLKENEGLIVDSHIAHLLPKSLVSLCIILTCSNLKVLEKRLKKRKYSQKKIRENLDAEIFQICLVEAKEKRHKVLEINGCKKVNNKELVKKIIKTYKN